MKTHGSFSGPGRRRPRNEKQIEQGNAAREERAAMEDTMWEWLVTNWTTMLAAIVILVSP